MARIQNNNIAMVAYTEYVRDLYSWAEQKPYTWTYSVQMSHKQSREEGKELFITNFKLNEKIQTELI